MKFSEKLQFLRKEKNLSQEQLADMLDVSRQSVSKWESGQTYPEMDKLISICSIFKCTLDDLTNDEIKEINCNKKNKNNMSNIIDEFLDIIRRSIDMFKNMNFKSFITFLIELSVIIIILCIFNLPVRYIHSLGNEIFMNFGVKIGSVFSSIWNFILQVSYLILSIIVFVYIYKIRFLDRYNYKDENNNVSIKEENQNIKTEKSNEETKSKKDSSYTIFNTLGNIVILFIKFIILFMSIPFVFALFMLAAVFIVEIIAMFKGIWYFGPVLMTISGGVFVYILLELVFNFIFNKKNNIKRIFIMIICSIIGLGISFGICCVEISNTKFINNVPKSIKQSTITKEYEMANNLFVKNNWYSDIEYIEDENITDKLKIELDYYQDYSDITADINKDDGSINIYRNSKETVAINKAVNLFVKNLANKTVYNYGNLYSVKIKVYSSKNNINTIKENISSYNKKIEEQEILNEMNEYNDNISEYQKLLDDKDEKINNLESKNDELEQKIEEYKNKIQEFKDILN